MNLQVRVLSIDKIKEKEEQLLSYVSPERREKAMGMLLQEKRLQEIGSGYFLKRYLPGDRMLSYTKYHKPVMDGIYFNLSHSCSYVAFFVSDVPCGIDIEKIREHRQKLIPYAFSEKEAGLIHDDQDFFLFWTRKEALSKASGLGLIGNDIKSVPSLEGNVSYQEETYQVKSLVIHGYAVSIALKTDENIDKVKLIEEEVTL